MSEGLSISGADDAKRALEKILKKTPLAADRGVAAVAHAYEAELKKVLNTVQNNGKGAHIGAPGGFPNRRTGRLSNSIRVENVGGLGTYARQVGPGMIYGRSLELGNPRWRSNVRYPFMEPVARVLRPAAQRIFTQEFKRNMGL